MKPDFIDIERGVELYCADCLTFAPDSIDVVITDPPFSDRTHDGHDASANGNCGEGNDGADRKGLGYVAWDEPKVEQFCGLYHPPGWMAVITDHVLAPFWEVHQSEWRYVFAPLPSFTPGRSVRLSGDGPSSWTDWIIVSRTAAQVKWGTLPGGYINSRSDRTHMGGKPLGLMLALVQDYSRHGNCVCDPCMGSGTTGIACLRTGRKFIGIEKDPRHFQTALDRIKRELAQTLLPL